MMRRKKRAGLGLLAFAFLSACHSAEDRANAYEGQYDRMMAVQAFPAALSSIQKAVKADDSSARRYLKLAEVQMALNRPAAAAPSFQAALDLEPDNIEALQNLSILSVRGGQYDTARRYIDPLLALSPNDPAGLLASGAIALAQRRFAEAASLSDKIIAAMPDRAEGYVLKAKSLDSVGKTREAIDMLEARILAAEDPKDLLIQVMTDYRKIGDTQGIRTTAIRLMPLFPDDPRYALESARAYHALGKTDQVRTIIDDLEKRFARSIDVMLAVANFWRDTQPLLVARREIARMAAAATPRVRSALADRLIDFGDAKNAARLLASLAPENVTGTNVDSQTHYARALLATGDVARTQAKVDAVIAYDAGNSEALLLRSRLKLLARNYRGAFTDAQLVANDDEQNEQALLLVAEIYAAQGNQLLAAGAYGNARRQFPTSVTALRAEIAWLIAQDRLEEAGQRAAAFYHARPRDSQAEQTYRDVCRKTRAAACNYSRGSALGMIS